MYNDLLDGESIHSDDLTVIGPALDAVNFISVDLTSAANRNLGYLRERIERERAYQEKNDPN